MWIPSQNLSGYPIGRARDFRSDPCCCNSNPEIRPLPGLGNLLKQVAEPEQVEQAVEPELEGKLEAWLHSDYYLGLRRSRRNRTPEPNTSTACSQLQSGLKTPTLTLPPSLGAIRCVEPDNRRYRHYPCWLSRLDQRWSGF